MWYVETIEKVITELKTDVKIGLSEEEVIKRRQQYGENKLSEGKKKTLFQLFFEQFNDILIYILLGAALVSALLGEISDAVIILVVVIINAFVGVIEESKAEKSLDALKKLSSPKAIVKRNGELKEVTSEDIVVGDIIIIDAGRYIPCDIRLVESSNLKIEESALTGESVPSEKYAEVAIDSADTPLGDQSNMAFMSTLVTYGRGVGIAVSTGMNTQIGKIASMLQTSEKESTPLQKRLEEFGKYLGIAILIICAVMFAVNFGEAYFTHQSLGYKNILEMFLTSVSLAVAAIPEGLPAIVTIVLAIGVQKMIKEKAIVRKLPAVETLGSVNIICSDKTGTLTQNKMTVTKFFSDGTSGSSEEMNVQSEGHKLMLYNLTLCNDATYSTNSETGDPTEIALLKAASQYNIFRDELNEKHARIDEIPFDSDRKLMTTVNKFTDGYYVFTKGAVGGLLDCCKSIYYKGNIVELTDELKEKITQFTESMSSEALRVLGTAYKKIDSPHVQIDTLESELVFTGMVGMIDPPRLEVKDSISLCKKSGIKTVMITGDHKSTAFAIAKELGIASSIDEAISGVELDRLSDDELAVKIDTLSVFARVSPEHKVKIVTALKSKDNVVSMTGDGVNDAPSLKAADIGVAMGKSGTDVAKGASDMILMDDNFKTIVKAIEEGRNIYSNIKKSILFLLSCNLGEIVAIFVAILLDWSSPLKPIHILWVNLITDVLPALALGMDPADPEVMKDKPRAKNESLFADGGGIRTIGMGIFIGVITLFAYRYGLAKYNSVIHAQTMAFVVLSISELFHSFNMRNSEKSIFTIGLFTNKMLILSLIVGVFLQNVIIAVPSFSKVFKVYALSPKDLIFAGALSISTILVDEIVKIFIRAKKEKL